MDKLPTPAFIVDREIVRRNTQNMINSAKKRNIEMRPHMKTHKTIEGAKLMLAGQEPGKQKMVVSTLAEARFYAAAGFKDILYAITISPSKIPEVDKLAEEINIHLFVDNVAHLEALRDYSVSVGNSRKWSVFLKIDCGNHRAGVDPDDPNSLELANTIVTKFADYVDFQGIYAHAGQAYKSTTPQEIHEFAKQEVAIVSSFARKLREEKNIRCKIVSIGSTPTCTHLPDDMGEVNEIHPGNYVFYDWMQHEMGNIPVDDIAVTVLARVVGHYPQRNQFMIDAGALALFSDQGCVHLHTAPQFGAIMGHTDLRVVGITQELGKVENIRGEKTDLSKFPIGSFVRVFPNHSCLTAALYPEYEVIENGNIVEKWLPNRGW